RSQGLIRFVSDFRNLTKIPQPKVATESVAKVLEHIQVLFNHELAAKNIKISFSIEPVNLAFSIDKELIDQVLINILQNAVHALEETTNEKHIMVRAFANEYNRPTIVIRDNGCGIDEE